MKNKYIVGLLLILIFTSCRKEVGPQGETGAPGKVNVKTIIFNVEAGQWEQKPTSPSNTYETELLVTDITSEIIDSGSVELCLWTGSTSGWAALPQSNPYQSIYFTYNVSKISVYYMYPDSNLVQNPGEKKFKVVIIAGQ